MLEKLSKGNLPREEYPCMNDPSPSFHSTPVSTPPRTTNNAPHVPAQSVRSRRTGTWARPRNSDDGYSRYTLPLRINKQQHIIGNKVIIPHIFLMFLKYRYSMRTVYATSLNFTCLSSFILWRKFLI